jgi:hypothetical protein
MKAISKCSPLWLLAFCLAAAPLHAAPVISEFLADNDNGLKDEDGDDEDWIEIHNPDATPVDLAGWQLSDNAAVPAKWVFPSRILPPGGYLVLFASNKNRKPASGNLHTNFKLSNEGDYLALRSPTGLASTTFNPYPPQVHNVSFGRAYVGTLTTNVLTPGTWTAGTNYNRVKLNGVGASVNDNTQNIFDDGLATPEHQQYYWLDYTSAAIGNIPAANTIIEATLTWQGSVPYFAGVSGLSTVPGKVGVFTVPNAAKGVSAIATGADGLDLVDYYAATTPVAEVNYLPGDTKNFTWNVTSQITAWKANPTAPQRGQFMLMTSAAPAWVAFDQNQRGPALVVRSVNSPNPTIANGYMTTLTPGASNPGGSGAGPIVTEVTENPPPPDPALNTGFVVRAKVAAYQGGAVSTVTLSYLKDFGSVSTTPMVDNGTNGDILAGDGLYAATIPASHVTAGRLLRWRVAATDASGYTSNVPQFRHPLDSPNYFGTVPQDSSIATNLTVLHWFIATASGGDSAAGTRCSIFLNGELYDNVGINLHGQSTSGSAFLKKSYDIDGNRGYRFKWSMDPTKPRAKDIKLRHDMAYEMNRLAGVHAHEAFLMHVRQNGSFKGLYDFMEDGDDVYLERTGLNKNGVLYKMYNNMLNPASDAVAGAEKKSRKFEKNYDLQTFINGMNLTDTNARRRFLLDNVDLPKMVNFMAMNTVTGNIDLHAKNYYIYSDSLKSDLWTLLPWDLDLSQGRWWNPTNNYFDDGIYTNKGGIQSGTGQGLVARCYNTAEFADMVKRRVRTLQDRFFGTNAVAPDPNRWYDARLQQMAANVGNDAVLDAAAFASAPWKNDAGNMAQTTQLTTTSALINNTMNQEVSRVLDLWVKQRVDLVNADTANVAASQNLATLTALTIGSVDHSPTSGNQDQEYVEIRNPNLAAVDISGWKITGGITHTFEPGTVIHGRGTATYASLYLCKNRKQFKLRTTGPSGNQGLVQAGEFDGHLSSFGETINLTTDTNAPVANFNYVGTPTPQQLNLVISEIMYNPAGDDSTEYVEITNISPTLNISLAGVKFTGGLDFDFSTANISSLAPGARAVIVRDVAAFQALNNAGENMKLEDGLNNTIKDFSYSPLAPWPTLADGRGSSLVLINPMANPDPSIASNWRASTTTNGNPGGTDSIAFTGVATADLDKDGLSALMEYALGTSDSSPNSIPFSVDEQPNMTGNAFILTVVHPPGADAVRWCFYVGTDLTTAGFVESPHAVIDSSRDGNGNVVETIQVSLPANTPPNPQRYFLKGCVVLR